MNESIDQTINLNLNLNLNQDQEQIYNQMFDENYSSDDIRIYFLIKYNIDINNFNFELKKKRIDQDKFKQKLEQRFNSKCILTNSSIYQACHIIPHSESNNMNVDNGLLLNFQHHEYFDKYWFSINPETLYVEINYKLVDSNDFFISMLINKRVDILENYSRVLEYLKKHYDKFIDKIFID
jgi:predicted restriction endonuclease